MMKKIMFIVCLSLLIIPQIAAAGLVPCGNTADDPSTPDVNESHPCQLCDFFVMAGKIVNFLLFTIVPPLAVLMVVIGGAFFILGSGYDPSLVQKGRAILSSVAIGLLLTYGSWVIVNLFFVAIGLAQTELGNKISDWFVFPCGESGPSSMMEMNANQQSAAADQPLFFVGVNQPAADEDIPLPPF